MASLHSSRVKSTMPSAAEACFLSGDARHYLFDQNIKDQVGWEFQLERLRGLGTTCPPISSSLETSASPQLQVHVRSLLPFLWLTRVSTTACSFRKRCSSHSTSWSFSSNHWNTQAQSFKGGYSSYRCRAVFSLAVFFFFFKGLNYCKKKVSNLRNFRTPQGFWPITLRGLGKLRGPVLLTMSDSFILMVILLTASVALLNILRRPAPLNVWVPTARGSYKTKKAGWQVICCPYFRFRRISIHQMSCPKLAK